MSEHLFTSESVTEGHPDKICDQVSDAVLDAIIGSDPACRVACETLVKTGFVLVAGEITTTTYVDMPAIVRKTVRETATTTRRGLRLQTCGILTAIEQQSPDIAQGVDGSGAYGKGGGAGDQDDVRLRVRRTRLMPLPITLAHAAASSRRCARRALPFLRPDGGASQRALSTIVPWRSDRRHLGAARPT